MVLAGIDEAGYGPQLGPLTIGCTAFELDAGTEGADEVPCLWKRLGRLVSKSRSKSGRKLHVNDSKLVYSPATGVRELERSVLAVLAACGRWPSNLGELLTLLAPDAPAEIAEHAWYQPFAGETFPIEADSTATRLIGNALRAEMNRTRTRCVYVSAFVVPERQFNRLVKTTRNKSSVSFSFVARHIDHLLRTYGPRGLLLYCDRQGGREHYGSLLRLMFSEWGLEVIREQDGYAEYVLRRNDNAVRLIFCEEAEKACLSVALASMVAKYLREALMRRFNAWWAARLPGLVPTAGYYGDAGRFLADTQAKRRELGIADNDLIRLR